MRKILFFLSLVALAGCGKSTSPQTLMLNREGNALLLKQSYAAAVDKYVEALKYDPFKAELHLNMGLAFEGLQQPDKALQSYAQADKLAASPEVKFMARFNQAQLLAKGKKVDEALALYQKALEIEPTSKETKTNIELLTQQQQGQGGQSDNKDNKDQKQNQQQQQNQQNKDNKDKKDNKDNKDDKNPDKQKQDKKYENSPKYQPRKFDSKDLSESDVKKILGELRQQEQKIRAEFNRKDVKEQPREKDW